MTALRRLVSTHRRLAAMLLALALCVKLIVPGGYMPVATDGAIMVSICSGTEQAMGQAMDVAMPGMVHHESDGSDDHRKAQMPCAFSGPGVASLAAVDGVQLAALVAFVVATGTLRTVRMRTASPAYLRPPLRGPPAAA